jgi:hypothetical protein
MSDEAWIISIAAAARTSFSPFAPDASPAAMVSTPRTRFPAESSARRSGAASGAGACGRSSARNRSISARREAK